jgi:hypothetical protein
MMYTNSDKFTDHLISTFEDSENEECTDDDAYQLDSNDDGFYDRFYDGY